MDTLLVAFEELVILFVHAFASDLRVYLEFLISCGVQVLLTKSGSTLLDCFEGVDPLCGLTFVLTEQAVALALNDNVELSLILWRDVYCFSFANV